MSASVDNITLTITDEIDNIGISYFDLVDNINIEYLSEVDNVKLSIGEVLIAGVSTVNGSSGDIVLTASAQLSLTTTSAGYYDHTFVHNLNDENVMVSIFSPTNSLVFSDVINEGSNYVNIRSAIDLTGYKAVAQR